jgi:hypothetical protein
MRVNATRKYILVMALSAPMALGAIAPFAPRPAAAWECECHMGPAGQTCYGACGSSGKSDYFDDGAPCRGGWFHGPVWDALLGSCPSSNSAPANNTPAPPVPAPNYRIGAIIPDSSTRYLTSGEVSNLSLRQLFIARNEIYARKGRIFITPELTEYFSSYAWYHPYAAEVSLNALEEANVKTLHDVEKEHSNTAFFGMAPKPPRVSIDTDEPSCIFDGNGICKSAGGPALESVPSVGSPVAVIGNMRFVYPVVTKATFDKMSDADKIVLSREVEKRNKAETYLIKAQSALAAAKANPVNKSPAGQDMIAKLESQAQKSGGAIDAANTQIKKITKKYVDAD